MYKFIRIIFVRIILSIEHCVGGIPTAVRVGSESKASELSTQPQLSKQEIETKMKTKIYAPYTFFPLFLGTSIKLRKATISFLISVSVCLRGTTLLPLEGFSQNFIFLVFFENLTRNFKFH